MSRTARTIIGLIVAVLVVVLLGLVYIWVTGGSATPSATLSAPTLDLSTRSAESAATSEPTSTPATEEATESATDQTDEAATDEPVVDITDEATVEATAETAAVNTPSGDLIVFNIETDDSEVRFILDEILRGQQNTVTGRTNQIAGQIAVDFENPQNSQVGEIRISARALHTDTELRDRAIRGQILQSAEDRFEFISFVPTEITGLPSSVEMGESFEFQITGDLTIRDITNPITFDVTVTPVSETRIEGTATAAVQRGDYNLEIPNVPGVADVDQEVQLEIDFVATAAS